MVYLGKEKKMHVRNICQVHVQRGQILYKGVNTEAKALAVP